MDYPKFIVSNQKEESISIQRVNKTFQFQIAVELTVSMAASKGHASFGELVLFGS